MKKSVIFYLLVLLSLKVVAQTGYSCQSPISLTNTSFFSSANAAYANSNAAQNGLTWFSFDAKFATVTVTVSGAGTGGTLVLPTVALYAGCGTTALATTVSTTANVTAIHYEGLKPGTTYYLAVGGKNTGTFKLSINNYDVPPTDGEDCTTAMFIDDMSDVHISTFLGAGNNSNESVGTCLEGGESNSTWYKWKATNDGSLVFTLTPDQTNNDLDFVLYDLDTTGDCANVNAKHALRCAAGSGVECPTGPAYYKTGLAFDANDVNEQGGCGLGQDGKVKFINMIKGHIYGLLINNFTGSSGFTITFKDQNGQAGTGSFGSPLKITYQVPDCVTNKTYVFNNDQTSRKQYKWDFGEGAQIIDADAAGNYEVYYSTTGERTVSLTISGATGTTTTTSVTFDVPEVVTPLMPDIIADKTAYCLGDKIKLSTTVIKGYKYIWTLPNGSVVNASELTIPVTKAYTNGAYTLVAKNDICVSQVSSFVPNVGVTPVAAFAASPKLGSTVTIPASVSFINQTVNGDSYLWDFGDGSTTTETDPHHVYAKGGKYRIKLVAYNNTGCAADTTEGDLIIKYGNTILIPNTFTPNNDGVNDKLVISITYISKYKLQVFNRLGQLMYQSTDIENTWDGTYKGAAVPTGTYYYIVNATGFDGNTIKESGYVAVLR